MDSFRARIDEVLDTPGLGRLVADYFHPGGPFAGESFDVLGDNPPDAITRDDLRPPGVGSPSLLRLLDVAIWMRHSGSGNAKAARSGAGVPEPGA